MYVPEPHAIRQNMTPQMFADLILDVLPHYRVLRADSAIALLPNLDPGKPLEAPVEKRIAVDGLLTLIRQTQVQSEDVACIKVFKFIESMPMPESNRAFLEWVKARLNSSVMPTEKEVELWVSNGETDKSDTSTLVASARYVAALHLYGRLVHRKYLKRLHLGHLIKSVGEQLVFDKCAEYAEHTACDLINLAMIWRAVKLGESRNSPLPPPGAWIEYPEEALVKLVQFLKPYSEELNQGEDRGWRIPF